MKRWHTWRPAAPFTTSGSIRTIRTNSPACSRRSTATRWRYRRLKSGVTASSQDKGESGHLPCESRGHRSLSYQAINIQITEPGPLAVWEANSLTLDGTASSRSLIFTDLADHRLSFGLDGVVDAIGFYINNGAFLRVPMWNVSVVSLDGTETSWSLVGPLSPDSKACVEFLSQSGISSITVANATVNGAVNWDTQKSLAPP